MRIYYGWFIVAVSLVILTLVLGATYHSFGVFVLPTAEEFGLSRADANTSAILFGIGGAIVAPFIGKLLDQLPIRRVMLVCALLMGVSLVILGLSHMLWLSAAVLAVPLAIAAQGGTISATTLVARWFTVYRARAMAIALFGMSLAGVVMPWAMALGVEHLQWRNTLVVTGVVVGAILLVAAFFIRERPGPNDVESTKPSQAPQDPHAAPADAKPLKAISLLAMPQFWSIGLATAATLGFTGAVMITLVPLGQGAGAEPTQAAGLIGVLAAAGLVGGFVAAWIGDRVDRTLLLAGLYIAVAAVAALFYFNHSFAFFVVGAALWGLATGIASPAFHALIADRFGPASFGTAYGLMSVLMTLFNAIATRYAGEVFDRTHAYDLLFLTIIATEVVAAALMFGTRLMKSPASAQAAGAT